MVTLAASNRVAAHGALLALVMALCPLAALADDAATDALLSPLFHDHAVLQRDQPIRIRGRTEPGRQVRVALAARHATTRASRAGTWEVVLASLPAGGPHTLTVSDGRSTRTAVDLLMGDVWLCSGQSNMELPVWRSLDAASELADVHAPTIRLLTVPQTASPVPLAAFATAAPWQVVSAATLKDFSAGCFYFARELQKTVDVPLGLIHASWGGSRIEAWIAAGALQDDPRFREPLQVLAQYGSDPLAALARWGTTWRAWWQARAGTPAGDAPWSGQVPSAREWRDAPAALGAWEHWGEPALADFNGMVWFRTTVALTPAQASQDTVLDLGAVDETDMTWVNGRAVGGNYGPGTPRHYPLSRGLLQAGRNTVVVNVLDTYREGGMQGPASAYRMRFADGSSVRLDGWQYRIAAQGTAPPGAPWQSAGGLSTLYNGMIAPLGHIGLRGVLWYQGESNTGEATAYADLLRRLGHGWRARFGASLPIVVVQLAGYGTPASAPGESGWASLRDVQRQVVRDDPRMALVVALDIGDRYDIHPPNKQELGRRLARAARHVAYGQALPASGPVASSAVIEGDAIAVHFDDIGDGLLAYGGEGPVGFELCGAMAGSCRYADARIRGSAVVLRAGSATHATRVRYGWADNPVTTLFDRAGLPAGPFEITVSAAPPAPATEGAR